MAEVVWCVPNFSEGRRTDVIERIVGEVRAVEGVKVLDVKPDADHNRVVVSFVGGLDAVGEAAFRAVRRAASEIDLTAHKGEHPRMGATDVLPFVPVSGVSMEQCVELSKRVGQRIGTELGIPVFLYERSAARPDRENLADIRKGEFEGLRERIGKDASRVPDFGPDRIHPTAGAMAVGARPPLIAYNVNLGTSDLKIAKSIAKAVRHGSGGYRYVKALGFEIKERGIVQVSMNLVDYTKSPLHRAYEAVKLEAGRYGVPVVGSEVVGLIPLQAIVDTAEWYLRFEGFETTQVIETRIWGDDAPAQPTLASFLGELASESPAPGGGSASAAVGATGAALLEMVCNLTVAGGGGTAPPVAAGGAVLSSHTAELRRLREGLLGLSARDAEAYRAVAAAMGMPRSTDAEKQARRAAVQAALRGATEVPLEVARACGRALALAAEVASNGNPNAISDAACGARFLHAGLQGALHNVAINLASIKDAEYAGRARGEAEQLGRSADAALSAALAVVDAALKPS